MATGAKFLGSSPDIEGGTTHIEAARTEKGNIVYLGGDKALSGVTGSKGETGSIGATGVGVTGVDGPTGPTGITGSQGPTGNTGLQGTKGDTGETGSRGITGSQGLDGPTGPTGADSSVTGPTGADSTITGPTGSSGATYNWTGPWVTGPYIYNDCVFSNGNGYVCILAHTSTAGSEPGIGANEATYWDMFVQKGPTGADSTAAGSTGPTGPSGPTGAGITGPTGPPETTGARGPTGADSTVAGPTGPTGSTGTDGTAGIDGEDGLGDRYAATSSDTETIPSSHPTNVSMSISTGRSYSVGQNVVIAHSDSQLFKATVVTYDSDSGLLNVNSISNTGSGAFNEWWVNLYGGVYAPGPTGPLGPVGPSATGGSVPNVYQELSSTIESQTGVWTEIPGLTGTITIDTNVPVYAEMTLTVQSTGVTGATGGYAVVIDGVTGPEFLQYHIDNKPESLYAHYQSMALATGTYGFTGVFRRSNTDTGTVLINEGSIHVMAMQAAIGPTGVTGADSTVTGPTGSSGATYNWTGTWITGTYIYNDCVFSNGNGYVCILAHTSTAGSEPGVGVNEATYWDIFVQRGPTGADSDTTGPTGATGIQGEIGPTGADSMVTGPTGNTGPTGADSTVTGPTGADSTVTGPTGPTGGAEEHYWKKSSGTGSMVITGAGSTALGEYNTVIGHESTAGVGSYNFVFGNKSNCSGLNAEGNIIGGSNAYISGGAYNAVFGQSCSVTGSGSQNIIGGQSNIIDYSHNNIVGGRENTISEASHYNLVGGYNNIVTGGSIENIVGGYSNYVNGNSSIVSGRSNVVSNNYANAGGENSKAENYSEFARSSGKFSETGDAQYSTIHCYGNVSGTTGGYYNDVYPGNNSSNKIACPTGTSFAIDINSIWIQESGNSGTTGDYCRELYAGCVINSTGALFIDGGSSVTFRSPVIGDSDIRLNMTGSAGEIWPQLKVTGDRYGKISMKLELVKLKI